jgi:CHAT domain-containing protein
MGAHTTAAWLSLRLATGLAARPAAPQRGTKDRDQALAAFEAALTAARASGDPVVLAQVLEAQADAFAHHGAFADATEHYVEAAQTRARVNPRSLAFAQIVRKQARAWRESLNPANLAELVRRGYTLDDEATRTLEAADAALAMAARLTEQQAPDSLALARVFNEQALVAARRVQLDTAARLQQRAAAIEQRLSSGTPEAAATRKAVEQMKDLWRLTANTFTRVGGRFIEEQAYLLDVQRDLDRARQIFEQLYPGCDEAARGEGGRLVAGCRGLAHALNNLGMVTAQRGNPAAGQRSIERALRINQALRTNGIFDPPSALGAVTDDAAAARDVSRNLNNLGTVAWLRGDLEMAVDYYQRPLDFLRACGPRCADALALTNRHLAKVAVARGDPAQAARLYAAALEIDEAALKAADPRFSTTPLERAVATDYRGLGDVARLSHDYANAERLYGEALSRQRKAVPKSLELAETLGRLGVVARDQGDLAGAEARLREAVTLATEIVPDSVEAATAAHVLGTVLSRAGRLDEAAAAYGHAIAMLENGTSRLGGAEDVRSRFVARRGMMYYDYIKLLVDRKQYAAAFQVLERSRAQSLRSLLAERDLAFGQDVPEALDRQRREINGQYERVDAELRAQPSDPAPLRARLRELRDQRQAIADRIREASPRLAAIEYPEPLAEPAARAALDRGTLLLSYAVGDSETLLFVLQPGEPLVTTSPGLVVLTLPVGRAQLQEDVRGFRAAVGAGIESSRPARNLGRRARSPSAGGSLEQRAADLFDTLVRPASRFVAASTRVLVSADGPLHGLPFGALLERDAAAGQDRYLVEWKPLHLVASTTVYAELKKRRWTAGDVPATDVVAFGDPHYGEGSTDQERDLAGAARGELQPLIASRAEVERIAALYEPRAHAYLGRRASEEQLKQVGTATGPTRLRYLHVASHGLLDDHFPLNSGLALSIPAASDARDNGLLQAWEIYEQLRLDADLVTLSACETGFGEEIGGEGLISLSRAFLYAGAHSVLATLWSVNDESTADLMVRFYTHLKSGRSKDEALRAAQIDFIRGQRPSSGRGSGRGERARPYHWAAFSVIGDWR